jgi:transketolase
MRSAFSEALVRFAIADSRVLLLTGDHGYSLFDEFRKQCPKQYFNAGIAEQNMVGAAAGLARGGFIPFVYGLSAFVPVRVLEQIKIDVCHDELPVIFIGDGAGFVYSHLGTSHQSTEDIACLRALPHLTLFSPADRSEMTRCMELAYRAGSPIYLRMGKADLGNIHESASQFSVGELVRVKSGNGRIHFVATGSMVSRALVAAEAFPDAAVTSVPTLKPIKEEQVIEICRRHDLIVTMEEHSVVGGLGSAIAEIASTHSPVKICRIGVEDRFSEHCGTYDYLLTEHRLDRESVHSRIKQFLCHDA